MEPVYLRALEIGDLERTYKWHNDQELYKYVVGPFRFVSHATEEEWLKRKITPSPNEVNLAICVTGTDQHIGNFYIQDIDWISRHACLGALIGEAGERGKGLGTVANHLIIRYAFQDLGLNRLWASVLEDNPRAIKHLEKCGYKIEGKMRQHAFKDGRFKDVYILGICAQDVTFNPVPNEKTEG